MSIGMRPTYANLALLADVLTDVESLRISTENRLRALEADKLIPGYAPEVVAVQMTYEGLVFSEKMLTKQLEKAMFAHNLGAWCERTLGVGKKQLARFLGTIGDPTTRSLRQLWAYCGLHVVRGEAPRHMRGIRSNWNNTARMRVWLIATSAIKHRRSPYRPVYDAGREKYSELTDGHAHNRAIRLVMKQIVKDIWREARSNNAPVAEALAVESSAQVEVESTPA